MGGFVQGILSGLAQGVATGIQQQNLLTLQRRAQQQKAAAEFIGGVADNAATDPVAAQQLRQLSLQIQTDDPTKFKAPKVGEAFLKIIGEYDERAQQQQRQKQSDQALATMMPLLTPPPQPVSEMPSDAGEMFAPKRGTPIPEPVPIPPPLAMIDPERLRQAKMADIEAVEGVRRKSKRQERREEAEDVRAMPGFQQLSPVQQIELQAGATNVSREPQAQAVTGTVRGSDLIGSLPADALGNAIDPDREYRVTRNAQGQPLTAYPSATADRVIGAGWFRDPESKTGWTQALRNQKGDIVRVMRDLEPPPGYLPTTVQTVTFQPDAEGNIRAIPYTRTVSKETTAVPVPAPPGMGGQTTIGGTGRIVGRRPDPMIPEGTADKLYGLRNALDLFGDTRAMLDQPKFKTLGPLLGRIKLAEVEKLGGLGASQSEIELANHLRILLRSQAFQEGGKQLTGTELEQFKATTPNMDDTIEQALVKTRSAIRILNRALNTRVHMLPKRYRDTLPADFLNPAAVVAVETPPPPGSGPKVGEIRHHQGTDYRFDGSQWVEVLNAPATKNSPR